MLSALYKSDECDAKNPDAAETSKSPTLAQTYTAAALLLKRLRPHELMLALLQLLLLPLPERLLPLFDACSTH